MRISISYLIALGFVSTTSCRTPASAPEDQDGDGYGYVTDCNDQDPSIYPGSAIYEDPTLCYLDADGDGYGDPNAMTPYAKGSDCDDRDPTINPGSIEYCDGIDQNCDGEIDDGLIYETLYPDEDGDGFGAQDAAIWTCSDPPGHVRLEGDCDDANNEIHPTATEVCDGGTDNDCNGLVDDEDPNLDPSGQVNWWLDSDGDGFGVIGEPISACSAPEGYVATSQDCVDSGDLNGTPASEIHPDSLEYCDDIDNDCDGLIDDQDDNLAEEGSPRFYGDLDGDGYGDPSNWIVACHQPTGWSDNQWDCLDTGSIGTLDAAEINPDAQEICDTVDNDCDGLIDDEDNNLDLSTAQAWHLDADLDGYGDPDHILYRCIQPQTHVADNSDCVDNGVLHGFPASSIHPGAIEQCDPNLVDNACDGPNDAGLVSFESQAGAWQTVSHLQEYASSGPGSLHICEGEHQAQLDILHNIDIQSHGSVTLNGEGLGSVVNIQNGSNVAISNLSITNGSGDLWAGEWIGGGINCAVHAGSSQASLTINNVDLHDNIADLGSAIYAKNCDLTLSNSNLRSNELYSDGRGAALYLKSGDLESHNNDYRNNFGGLNAIELIDSNATLTQDILLSNAHEECAIVFGDGGNGTSSEAVFTDVQLIDNDSDLGAMWIRNGSELIANNIAFNGNSPFEVVTDEVEYHMGSSTSFNCMEQLSGLETKLRCGDPITIAPQYSTHLDTHYANGTQFHSALFTVPTDINPNVDSFGIKSQETLILECRTDYSIHQEENGDWVQIWAETVNHGNAIASQTPRLLRTSGIDIPLSGGETLLFGVVISNCTGVAFESPQDTNTYGQTILWDATSHIGPTILNSDRSFHPANLSPGLGGPHIAFQIHLTDEP